MDGKSCGAGNGVVAAVLVNDADSGGAGILVGTEPNQIFGFRDHIVSILDGNGGNLGGAVIDEAGGLHGNGGCGDDLGLCQIIGSGGQRGGCFVHLGLRGCSVGKNSLSRG